MKPIFILLIAAGLLLSACTKNTDMLTVINPDGSCYREFAGEVNRNFLLNTDPEKENIFPVDVDSNSHVMWKYGESAWQMQFPATAKLLDSLEKQQTDSTKKPVYYARLRLDYPDVSTLDTAFRFKADHSWSSLNIRQELKKDFQWFYTRYTYTETFPALKSDFEIPLDSFFTRDEALFWFTGQPNLTAGKNGIEIRDFTGELENKFNQWFSKNLWNNEFKVLLQNYDSLSGKPVSTDSLRKANFTIFEKEVKDDADFEMVNILNNYYHTSFFTQLWKNEQSPMQLYEKQAQEQTYLELFKVDFDFKLLMPGKILHAENSINQGDTLIWQLDAWHLIPGDYVIEAQSRKANTWAWILSGIIVLVALVSLLYKPAKKGR